MGWVSLRESGQSFEMEKVDLGTKKTETGEDFTKINPKGSVPALRVDNGEILTEAAVTLQYVADKSPGAELAPLFGSMERYRLMESLNFISSEVHKSFGALFNPNLSSEQRENQLEVIGKRCDVIVQLLEGKEYLQGNAFTVADAYLFTVLGWSHPLQVDLSNWSRLIEYSKQIADRKTVREAMQAEGLLS